MIAPGDITDIDAPPDQPRHSVDGRMKLEEAHELAKEGNLRILNRNGLFKVYRNTLPRLTYVGQAVDSTKLLALVRRAARKV